MSSASHPRADICAFMDTSKRMAPTILRAGAIRDHQAGYLRRAFPIIGVADYRIRSGPDHDNDHILRDACVMGQLFILISGGANDVQSIELIFGPARLESVERREAGVGPGLASEVIQDGSRTSHLLVREFRAERIASDAQAWWPCLSTEGKSHRARLGALATYGDKLAAGG